MEEKGRGEERRRKKVKKRGGEGKGEEREEKRGKERGEEED